MHNKGAHTWCIHCPIFQVLKLGLVVVVIVIIAIIHQVFRSPYKTATVPILSLIRYLSKLLLFTPKKMHLQPSTRQGVIHKSTCKTFVWSVMRTYPHRTCQVVMWHLYLLVPHQVFSLLWHQHWTLLAFHLSQHH